MKRKIRPDSETYLDTKEDLEWLEQTHKVIGATTYKGAMLYGNEDCPSRVHLFANGLVTDVPTIWEADEENTLRLKSFGTKPKTPA